MEHSESNTEVGRALHDEPGSEGPRQHRQGVVLCPWTVSRLKLVAAAAALLLIAGTRASAEDIPDRLLVQKADRADDSFEDGTLLWIKAEHLSRQLPPRLRDAALMSTDALDTLPDEAFDAVFRASSEDPLDEQLFWLWLNMVEARDRYGSARSLGLEDGQLLINSELCEDANISSEHQSLAYSHRRKIPASFAEQAKQSRASIVGRVTDIVAGFQTSPALLLELDVEESLGSSQFSALPFVLLPIGSFVAEDTVFCSRPRTFGGYLPQLDDRIVVMPTTGPWNEDRTVILLTRHQELFVVEPPNELGIQQVLPLVEAADGSTPKTLHDFRQTVWNIHDRLQESADASGPPGSNGAESDSEDSPPTRAGEEGTTIDLQSGVAAADVDGSVVQH